MGHVDLHKRRALAMSKSRLWSKQVKFMFGPFIYQWLGDPLSRCVVVIYIEVYFGAHTSRSSLACVSTHANDLTTLIPELYKRHPYP